MTCGRWVASVLVVVSMAAGCATPRVAYTKPGVSDAERRRDETECLRAAIGHNQVQHVLVPVTIDRELFQECLERRGYVQVRER